MLFLPVEEMRALPNVYAIGIFVTDRYIYHLLSFYVEVKLGFTLSDFKQIDR